MAAPIPMSAALAAHPVDARHLAMTPTVGTFWASGIRPWGTAPSHLRGGVASWEPRLSERRDHPTRTSVSEGTAPSSDTAGVGRVVTNSAGSPLVVLGKDDVHSEPLTLDQILQLRDDEALITALWHLSHRRLLRRALGKGVPLESAEDIVQDVFSLLADQLDRVRSPRLLGWLATMVDYECKRHFTKRKRTTGNLESVQQRIEVVQQLHGQDDPEHEIIRQRELQAAVDLLVVLEPLEAFIMRAAIIDELATPVVLDVLARRFDVQLTPRALYARRRRIRRALANRLAQQGVPSPDGGDCD